MTDTPYAGSSGWSGSATSRERADREDTAGITGHRSREVYRLLFMAMRSGMTDKEVQAALGIGHGASSGALTRLHRSGKIARLSRRRNGNEVYVHPGSVNGRETVPYRPNGGKAALLDAINEALDLIATGRYDDAALTLELAIEGEK